MGRAAASGSGLQAGLGIRSPKQVSGAAPLPLFPVRLYVSWVFFYFNDSPMNIAFERVSLQD